MSSKTIAVHVKKIGSEVENKPSQTLLTLRALERLGGRARREGAGRRRWQSLPGPNAILAVSANAPGGPGRPAVSGCPYKVDLIRVPGKPVPLLSLSFLLLFAILLSLSLFQTRL